MKRDYSRAIEKGDFAKIDRLYAILRDSTTTKDNYWDKVRKLTKRVSSDHSLSRWQCLAEYYEKFIIQKVETGQIIKGYISCGEKNPFYNEMIELEVTKKWVGRDEKEHIEVRTIEKRPFHHCLIDIDTNTITKEWVEIEHYESFLDTRKPYEIVK